MSVNVPVQGGATGDYPKLAMTRARRRLKELGWWGTEVRMLMNQHDSLVFEVSNSLDLQQVIDILTPTVQFNLAGIQNTFNQFELFPPMSVDWEAGKTWGSVVAIEDLPILNSTGLIVEMTENATVQDLRTVEAVFITNPGDVPVTLNVRGRSIQDRFKVAPDPSVISKLSNGDPEAGINHNTEGRVSARFIHPE
jgi:hypothetical protein